MSGKINLKNQSEMDRPAFIIFKKAILKHNIIGIIERSLATIS